MQQKEERVGEHQQDKERPRLVAESKADMNTSQKAVKEVEEKKAMDAFANSGQTPVTCKDPIIDDAEGSSQLPPEDVEAEMERLNLELEPTMNLYGSACKMALDAKEKVRKLSSRKVEAELKLEEARQAEEMARSITERERANCQAEVEAAEAELRLAQQEVQQHISAEIHAFNKVKEKKAALGLLANYNHTIAQQVKTQMQEQQGRGRISAMWNNSKKGDGINSQHNLVAIAIDKGDKGSQAAMKWAVDQNIANKAIRIILIHVHAKHPAGSSTEAEEITATPGHPTSGLSHVKEIFLPFRVFCARKHIQCKDVLLEGMDISKAIVEYVSKNAIDTLVVGASSQNHSVKVDKRLDGMDVPTALLKGAPDFCNVYIISKGKVSSFRPATRQAPIISPLRS